MSNTFPPPPNPPVERDRRQAQLAGPLRFAPAASHLHYKGFPILRKRSEVLSFHS